MKKYLVFPVNIILLLSFACGRGYNPEICSEDLFDKLDFLAGDSLKGRYPGTPEDSILLHYLSGEFKKYGLELYNESGIQYFSFISSARAGNRNSLTIGQKKFQSGSDFIPLGFSSSDSLATPVIFAGYGFDIISDEFTRNDYQFVDPTGKWVMILRGNPENNNQSTKFTAFEDDRYKAMLAKDKGAAGVILISGNGYDPSDNLSELKESQVDIGIPCIQIKRNVADILFSSMGVTTDEVEKSLYKPGNVISPDLNTQIIAVTDIIHEKTRSGNVIAFLEGKDPEAKDEYILIGAHHDHLGYGGTGSSSREPDTNAIHYGADDNASGVAAILELAEKFTSLEPERSIAFVTFGAEEKGIIGSRYFTENPPIPINKIVMMINIDMVGRMKPDSSLQVNGVGTSAFSAEIVTKLNKPYNFNLKLSQAGYGPSDHASFYAKDKPVLFFTTGVHKDYHTTEDRIDSLNINALSDITSYIADIALHIANLDSRPMFTEAGPKSVDSRGYRGKITLGIMPDVSADDHKGVEVLGVTEGRPASLGGIKKGDVIIAIDGKPVGDIYEYMFRLGHLKAGDAVIVTILRNKEIIDLLVQL